MVEVVRAPLHQNDAFLWIQETDPHLRSTTVGIALLDCSLVAPTRFLVGPFGLTKSLLGLLKP